MSKKEQFIKLAQNILELIGGKDNISFATHCMTRLRLNLKDHALIEHDKLKNVTGVLGVLEQNGQLQIIIGETVADLYKELCELAGLQQEKAIEENVDNIQDKKKFKIGGIFEVFSACFAPIVTLLAGAGVLKGIMTLCWMYGWLATDSGAYIVFNAAADAAFYFMPFLLAFTAAKKFNTSEAMAMAIAGIYMYPTILEGAGTQISFFGLNFFLVKYSASVLPVLISVWILSYLYRWLQNHIPKALKAVFVPLITLVIMAPLSLIVIGPIGYNIGLWLGSALTKVFDISSFLGGVIYGSLRQIIVFTGTHMALTPAILSNLDTVGYDVLTPVSICATYAVAGTCLGAFLKAKKQESKAAILATFTSAVIGVTEPALYGVIFRYKKLLIPLIVGGATGGVINAVMGGKCYAFIMSSILSLPAFGETIPQVVLGISVAFVLSAVLAYIIGIEEKQ